MRYLTILLLITPLLQGCLPVVATGVGAGVLMAEDRRTTGTYIDDEAIEVKARNNVSNKFKDQVHIDVTSFNRVALITGEAPTDAIKAEVEAIVRAVPNVNNVFNEMTIGAPRSAASHGNDAFITSKVKAKFIDANKFQINHVKVVTENSVVYLMGSVTQQEGTDAAEIASTTNGVSKVVKVFEYRS
jgi:osmotically-inducible protein OsmY